MLVFARTKTFKMHMYYFLYDVSTVSNVVGIKMTLKVKSINLFINAVNSLFVRLLN